MMKMKKYWGALCALVLSCFGVLAEETPLSEAATGLVTQVEANVNLVFPYVKTILIAVIGIAALIWIGRKLKGIAFGRG